MNQFSLNFDNNYLCIITPGQEGTEFISGLKKETFKSFIPEKYWDKASFTWDFETESITINKPYEPAPGTIITKSCFVPETVEPMPGLADRFEEFIKLLGMEQINLAEEIRKEMPELAKLIGY